MTSNLPDLESAIKALGLPNESVQSFITQIGTMNNEEIVRFMSIVKELSEEGGESEILNKIVGDIYDEFPIDTETFFTNRDYFGRAGADLYPKLLDDLIRLFEGNYTEVVLCGSIGLDALVMESDGGLPTLGERIGVSKNVTTICHTEGTSVSQTEPGHHSGIKTVRHLRVSNGMELYLTPEHEVQVVRNGRISWVKTKNIALGDMVAHLRRWRVCPSADLSDDLIKLLAYWATDGSSSKTRARFCDGNQKTSLEVVEILHALGFNSKREPKGNSCWEVYVRKVKTVGFLSLLRKYNLFGANTHTVSVPDAVCRSNDRKIALFLNRVWAAEGTCYTGNGKSPPRFLLEMCSERFIRQVQMILLRFGIQARINPIEWKDKRIGKSSSFGWQLAISGIDNLSLFLEHIGPVLGKENSCKEIARYCSERCSNTNVDIVPVSWGEANDLLIRSGVKRTRSSKWWTLGMNRKTMLSRRKFDKFVDKFGNCPAVSKLAALYHPDVGFSYVIMNDEVEGAIEVGDIGAYDGHRFVANGIGVHNSVGWGKSYLTEMIIGRIVYEVTCLKNPQWAYGLAENSSLFFPNISVTLTQAKRIIFGGIKEAMRVSPYFRDQFPFEMFAEEIRFPKNITLGAIAMSGALGENVFSAAMDETNFMEVVEKSRQAKGKKYDQAEVIYASLARRMKSRFMEKGKLPGMLVMISSAHYENDFTDRKKVEAKEDPQIFVLEYPMWGSKPPGIYMDKKFWVGMGTENQAPKIIEDKGEAEIERNKNVEVLDIPLDFLSDFKRDIEGSLREIAGKSKLLVDRFITQTEKIFQLADTERKHPFTLNETTLIDSGRFIRELLAQQVMGLNDKLTWQPLVNPKIKRFCHIDLAKTGNAAGFCIGHPKGEVQVMRRTDENVMYTETMPIVWIDVMLRIIPSQGSEINFGNIRSLIYELQTMGFLFQKVTLDSYQSSDTIQILKGRGIEAEELSIDKSMDPYNEVKTALYEDRLMMYWYDIVLQELKYLITTRSGSHVKVDHMSGKSKDVTDCVAGVVYNCVQLMRGPKPFVPSGDEYWK